MKKSLYHNTEKLMCDIYYMSVTCNRYDVTEDLNFWLLADCTARSMIGYCWHANVICLSVCPSVGDAVHCG